MRERWTGVGSPTVDILDCKACLGGEFSGNIDLKIACDLGTLERPEDRFTLRAPLDPEPLDVLGLGIRDAGFELSFNSEVMDEQGEIPKGVTLLFDGKEIAESPCRLFDSVRLGPDRFDEPTEILKGSASPSLEGIRTNRWWGRVLCTVGLGLLAAATVAVATGISVDGVDGFDSTTCLVTAILLGTLGLISLGLMYVPYQQVHIDLIRGIVREIKGRFVFFHFKELEAASRSLDEFSHLRIVERCSVDSDGDIRDVFLVSLEGPIEWGAEDGTVNSRSDGVHLREFGTRGSARRYAAQIALPAGMRILDTSETEL